MSKVNAPQPDAVNGAAEVFDSTILPSQGEVSQDALPGPDSREAPMHSGEMNGIDPFLFQQFIALTSFVWDTSMSVGQLLWSIPIHPTYVHVFLAHLSKMYNAFAGGFDFAVTVAGTGFHAGKLIIVRLPPNISPNSLQRISDITAFPYMVIDPKTLEVTIRSAMDQRNVMYHYMPYDKDNIQSFGGHLAMYVLLPLNTSSSGATQISVQVFSRPAQNFMFTQLRPLSVDMVNPYRPEGIEQSLDFTSPKTHPLFALNLRTMMVATSKEVKELTLETLNCVKLDKTPMNGELIERFGAVTEFSPARFLNPKSFCFMTDSLDSPTEKIYAFFIVKGSCDTSPLFTFDGIAKSTGETTPDNLLPAFFSKNVNMIVTFKTDKGILGISMPGILRKKAQGDPVGTRAIVFEPTHTSMRLNFGDATFPSGYLDNLLAANPTKMTVGFEFVEPPSFDINYKPYAPPITESVVTFQIGNDALPAAQPYELTQAILNGQYEKAINKRDSLVFELIDTSVELPLIPIRLHYDGYFSSMAVSKNLVYKFDDPQRYKFKFIGMIPETTALVASRLPLASPAVYAKNMAVSAVSSSSALLF